MNRTDQESRKLARQFFDAEKSPHECMAVLRNLFEARQKDEGRPDLKEAQAARLDS